TSSIVKVRRMMRIQGDDEIDRDTQIGILRQRALVSESSVQGGIGRDLRALIQYVPPLVRLVILGAGDDAKPLCTLAHSLGWHVCVADRRARLVTRSRFPESDQLVVKDWQSALRSITLTPTTAVVLMTHS